MRSLVAAIRRQAAVLQHSPLFNLTHGPAEDLASRLAGISPGMHRVFFSDNGSSAMEIAFKMALQYWQNMGERGKTKIATLENGYHGDTFGSMSVGYVPEFFGRFRDHLFGTLRFPVPGRRRRRRPPAAGMTARGAQDECLGRIEESFTKDGRIAAFVMESGAQLAGGAVIFPRGFQSGIRRLCRKHGVLFVLDEVATGFGRLGSMVQYTEQGGHPDIVAYGKMLTGGYLTLAATLATKRVYDSFLGGFDEGVHLFPRAHVHGNPIAAAAAVENMRMYERHGLIERIAGTSRVLRRVRAGDLRHGAGGGGQAQGDAHGDRAGAGPGEKDPGRTPGVVQQGGFRGRRRNGVYLRTLGGVVMLVPPLAISQKELAMLIEAAVKTIRDVGA